MTKYACNCHNMGLVCINNKIQWPGVYTLVFKCMPSITRFHMPAQINGCANILMLDNSSIVTMHACPLLLGSVELTSCILKKKKKKSQVHKEFE